MDRLEDQPANDEIEDRHTADVSAFQLREELELDARGGSSVARWCRSSGRLHNRRWRYCPRQAITGLRCFSRHSLPSNDLTSCRQDAPGASDSQLALYRPFFSSSRLGAT